MRSNQKLNFDTFDAKYKLDAEKLLSLYKDIINILDLIEKNKNSQDISHIIEKYNEFIITWNYFFEKIDEEISISNQIKIKTLDVNLYKNLDDKSIAFLLNTISLNINYLLLKYQEIKLIFDKLKNFD